MILEFMYDWYKKKKKKIGSEHRFQAICELY